MFWCRSPYRRLSCRRGPAGRIDRAIADHVARLIPDRATIELGLDAIPEAVTRALGRRSTPAAPATRAAAILTSSLGAILRAHPQLSKQEPADGTSGDERALFSRNAISKALTQTSGLGEDNGNHTHDTSRSSDNTKSFNLPDRARNVRHRWRRFYLRALWTCHVGGFRSFNNQRQSCLSVRRL